MTENSSVQTYLENTLWRTPTTSFAPRSKPLQVIAVGLSRSGTESLQRALIELGYDTYHGFDMLTHAGHTEQWVRLCRRKYRNATGEPDLTAHDFDVLLGNSHAVVDSMAATFAAELIEAYPNAKVILNTRRDVDAWYKSALAVFKTFPHNKLLFKILTLFSGELYWQGRVMDDLWWRFFYDDFDATGKWRYREHSLMIRALVPKEKLLEWTVDDGWQPLCGFLGKEVPENKEFPRGNVPKETLERVNRANVAMTTTAFRNMGICATLLVAIGVLVSMAYRMTVRLV